MQSELHRNLVNYSAELRLLVSMLFLLVIPKFISILKEIVITLVCILFA